MKDRSINFFVYLWKRYLFRRYYWQPEELKKAKDESDQIAKDLEWR